MIAIQQRIITSPGWQPLHELAVLLPRYLGTESVVCTPRSRLALKLLRGSLGRAIGTFKLAPENARASSAQARAGGDLLFLLVTSPDFLSMVRALPAWRKRYARVVAYVVDSFRAPPPDLARKFDHFFVGRLEDVERFESTTGVPTTFLPVAIDTQRCGPFRQERSVGVISYGRTQVELQEALLAASLDAHRPLSYRRSTLPEPDVYRGIQPREEMYRVLGDCHIGIAYDTRVLYYTHNNPGSFITPRWFEGFACGCVMAGSRLAAAGASELIDWPDAIIELPAEAQPAIERLHAMLEDRGRLAQIQRRNYAECRRRHDWRHRIQTLCQTLSIPPASSLEEDLREIEHKADEIASSTPA